MMIIIAHCEVKKGPPSEIMKFIEVDGELDE
jgi:hypothetical protein